VRTKREFLVPNTVWAATFRRKAIFTSHWPRSAGIPHESPETLKRKLTPAITVAFLLVAAAWLPVNASARGAKVTVSPGPTAGNASIWTEISFRGIAAAKAGPIKVRGSRTGNHSFSRKRHADNRGFSLVMKRSFRPSERVNVTTPFVIPGAKRGDYRFKVENIGGPRVKRTGNSLLAPSGPPQFRSRPDLMPPVLDVRKSTPQAGIDPIFVGAKSRGSAIYDAAGDPIWFRSMRSTDFRTQTFRGKPVLTWFESPTKGSGLKRNSYTIANQAYRIIKRFNPGNGYAADSHEFRLTPRNTAYITSYRSVRRDLRSIGLSRKGRVADSIAQEIDLKTGRVIWEWHSLDHVPVSQSYANGPKFPGHPYDYFHINSIIDTPDGNVMISGRSANAIYKVSRSTGRVIWALGGKSSDFELGPGALFSWQHDAEPLSGNRVSLFDNADSPVADAPWADQSRGLVLQLDNRNKTATVANEFKHPQKPLAPTQANVESLDSGNFLVGWGQVPWITEYTPDGEIVFDATVRDTGSFYRAYRQPWTGNPATAVDIAAEPAGSASTEIWASWNGDTSVRTWRVQAGPSGDSLTTIADFPRDGFETAMTAATDQAFVKVQGLGADGQVIGGSAAIKVR